MSAHVCGLDVHKRCTYATILGPDGEILAQKKMDNEEVPSLPQALPGGTRSDGGHHQHSAPVQKAGRRAQGDSIIVSL
jgi:hypothetical protein